VTTQTQSPPTTHTQSDLIASLHGIVRSGEELIAALTTLESSPRRFDGSDKDQLLHVIAQIEALTSALESRVGALSRAETQLWIDRLELLFDTWAKIDDRVDRTVALAIVGAVERGFFALSPIVNCGNLSERVRLTQLGRRLSGDFSDKGLEHSELQMSDVMDDPDLASFCELALEPINPIPHGTARELSNTELGV